MLTQAQKQLLKNSCSKIKADDFAKLPQDIVDTVMKRIDQVYIDLHIANPKAFLTELKVSKTGKATVVDNKEVLKQRHFFDKPVSIVDEFASAINHEPRPLRRIRK